LVAYSLVKNYSGNLSCRPVAAALLEVFSHGGKRTWKTPTGHGRGLLAKIQKKV